MRTYLLAHVLNGVLFPAPGLCEGEVAALILGAALAQEVQVPVGIYDSADGMLVAQVNPGPARPQPFTWMGWQRVSGVLVDPLATGRSRLVL